MHHLKHLLKEEKSIHLIFEVSLIFKAIFAALEVIGGLLAYFVSQQFLLTVVMLITQDELSEDSRDHLANYLIHSAQNFSVSAQHFAAFYLLSHGIIKLFVIIGLLRQKLWYYPTALVVFSLFIVYQLYRFTFTHSIWLLVLTAIDLVVIWLTWHEYRFLRDHPRPVSRS